MEKKDSTPAERREDTLKKLKTHYSQTVVDHCLRPRNFRKMKSPDGYAKHTGENGDIIEMFVDLDKNRIRECTFQTDACAATLACGSITTELITGRLYSDAPEAASPNRILEALGGLPEGNLHCAHKTSLALKRAIADALMHKQFPWKKNYRKY